MAEPPRALLFDLDGTLVKDGVLERATEQTVAELVAEVPSLDPRRVALANQEAFAAYFPEVEQAWTLGGMSSAEVVFEVWRRTLAAFGIVDQGLITRVQETFSAHARAGHRLFDDALPLLDAVRGRMPIAVITNGASDLQREKLEATGIGSLFDAVLVSGELGVAKPDPRIFEMALEQLDVPAEDAWHVGDNPKADVAGAIAAGVTAVWINRTGRERRLGEPEAELEIGTLSRLLELSPLRQPQ